MRRRPRNPLEPIGTVVFLALGMSVAGAVVAAAATIFGAGSFMGFGGPATIRAEVPGLIGGSAELPRGILELKPGVSAQSLGTYLLAVENPSFAQRVLFTLTLLPGVALFAGALGLLYRLIRDAERNGIFTVRTARRLRTLGWFLLGGTLVAATVKMLANNRLLATMVTNKTGWIDIINWNVSWTLLIMGAGVLTLARVMRIGAEMRDELQATV